MLQHSAHAPPALSGQICGVCTLRKCRWWFLTWGLIIIEGDESKRPQAWQLEFLAAIQAISAEREAKCCTIRGPSSRSLFCLEGMEVLIPVRLTVQRH